MGTTLRAELSEKNPYWIEKHRYYELKHFCLQYPIWKKIYRSLDGFSGHSTSFTTMVVSSTSGDWWKVYVCAKGRRTLHETHS